ncbi:PLP-dependent aminotransferase family protein [Comamonas sp. GB3 AK4-5]|uniref:aminotransferase-like domain-containing protein n=1 Tax=Comamonas sp. GB3 AK4-5 TaxID=3231487 RepID=UPI00351E3E61
MYRFSSVYLNPKGSPIRALYKHLSEPGMISFAGGYPDPQLFDVEGLGAASERAFANSKACLEYGATEGTPRLKEAIVQLMHERDVHTTPENIIVTTGSQQAFDLVLRVLVEKGDSVFVEQPTYSTNIQAVQAHQAQVSAVPVTAEGMDVQALERMLASASAQGEIPKLLYTIPNFSNPSGATLTVERRIRLLQLAVQYQFVLVEDDPYGGLRFSGDAVPSLMALASQVPGAQDWVVHMSSLSKIVAPGLRVGWAVAPVEILKRCSVAKQSADVGSSPWVQGIAAEYLASGRLNTHLGHICAAYGAKCRALAHGLRQELGDAISFHEPSGGMFVWARLTGDISAAELLTHAIARGVMFVPGEGFQADGVDRFTLRLSFATPSLEEVAQGCRRLGEALTAARAARSPQALVA